MREAFPFHPHLTLREKSADRAGSALPVLKRQRNQPDIPMPFHAPGGDRDQICLNFTESSPHGRLLATFHGRPLHFHDHARIRPAAEHLAWHARHRRIAS